MLRWIGALLGMFLGFAIIAVTAGTYLQSSLLGTVVSEDTESTTWSSETLYLSALEETTVRVVKPVDGEKQFVVASASTGGRAGGLTGVIVERWFSGKADVTCELPVMVSQQPFSIGFWLAKQGWPIVPGVILLVAGWRMVPGRLARQLHPHS